MATIIEMKNVSKRYDDGFEALTNLNLKIESGKFYSILGPSGSGKTTVLRIIAGFSDITSGALYFDNQNITDMPANQRKVNTVFQDYALFPHLNVFDNIAFGLKLKKRPKEEIKEKVANALEKVRLPQHSDREISELSGGQKQRIAIARAIVNEPKVLLLDESLSALDKKLRKDMQYQLRRLQKDLGITFVFVTHDQEEALALSDEIFIMNEGKIIQNGTATDIYDEPVNRFVAEFIGESNIVDGVMKVDYSVEFVGKTFECADAGMQQNEPVHVVLRPEDLDITSVDEGKLTVTIVSQMFLGNHFEVNAVDEDGNQWLIHATNSVSVGQKVGVYFDPEDIHVMRIGESQVDFHNRIEEYGE